MQETKIIHFKHYLKFGYALFNYFIIISNNQKSIHIKENQDHIFSLIENI